MVNDNIDNLYYFKLFYLELEPFNLNLDGNFCDEFYKYTIDIFTHAKRIASQKSFNYLGGGNLYEEVDDVEKMKQAFNELKKPYERKEASV